jgi:hypothetical protein
MQPTILHIEQTRKFRYLWLKYITGVSLDRHCARCLRGYYSDQVSPRVLSRTDILLDEYQAKYFYLCGVSSREDRGRGADRDCAEGNLRPPDGR